MTATKKTSLDRAMIALVITPPVALLLFCVSAAAKWQAEKAKIRPLLAESISLDVLNAPSPAAAEYAARTSTEKTRAIRELLHASEALYDKYRMMFDVLDDQDDWLGADEEEQPLNKYIVECLDEAKPILQALHELEPERDSIWLASEPGNPNHHSRDENSYPLLRQLLRIEFRYAVRAKETERAIKAFQVDRGLLPWSVYGLSHDLLPSVADSFATGVWSEAEIETIVSMMDDAADLNRRWERQLRGALIEHTPWLLSGEIKHSYRAEPIAMTYAPSRRVAWLKKNQRVAELDRIGTRAAADRILEINRELLSQNDSPLDVAVQFPGYAQFYEGGTSWIFVEQIYERIANQQRFTRTAAAVAKYYLQFDSYPNTLDDLSRVGLSREDRLDLTGRPFKYSSDQSGCRLANASSWFPNQYGSGTLFKSQEELLSAILKRYRELSFSAEPPSADD